MRLLSPETLHIVSIVCKDEDFQNATVSRKQVLSHAFVEVLKFKATNQSHPKMWIKDDRDLGVYLRLVYDYGYLIGCNFNIENIMKYDNLYIGFSYGQDCLDKLTCHFDSNYLFFRCRQPIF